MTKLDIFIEGENVDLCIPTLEFAKTSEWYSWFNNPHITAHTKYGQFPNTREKQEEFFLANHAAQRLMLIVTNKDNEPLGTVSIANINHQTRSGVLAIIFGKFFRKNPLEALEAVALITEHAFLQLGLNRIIGGQHINLIQWSQRMSLLGYRVEGIEKNGFVKGREIADMINIACHYEDFQTITKNRNGTIWDSQEKMLQRIKSLPKIPFHKLLQDFMKDSNSYYQNIFNL